MQCNKLLARKKELIKSEARKEHLAITVLVDCLLILFYSMPGFCVT